METLILGGGCFWCVEALFRNLRGVIRTECGYSGGDFPHPTTDDIYYKDTGHIEVAKIEFDSNEVSRKDLLRVFFLTHDPTSWDRQGADTGKLYRSVVFFQGAEQKKAVEEVVQELEDEEVFSSPIVTEVLPFENYYPAEEAHQDFYNKNREHMYCLINIDPKVNKLRQTFANLLRS